MTAIRVAHSIRKWLLSVYAALAVVPLVIMGLALTFIDVGFQLDTAEDLQREISKRAKSEIRNMTESLERLLVGTLKAHDLVKLSSSEQKIALSNIRTHFKESAFGDAISKLVLLDSSGVVLAMATRLEVNPGAFGRKWPEKKYFIEAVEGGVPYYGPVMFDEWSREPLITVSIPLYDIRKGGVDGIVMAEIRLKQAWNNIKDISLDFGGTVYIVDKSDWLVAHPDSSLVLRGTTYEVPQETGLTTGLMGERVFMASESFSLGDQAFRIVTERPMSDALSLPFYSMLTTGVFVTGSLLGSIAFMYLMVRRIIRPVESLAGTATAISAGDLNRKAERQDNDDEIGVLAETFNRMSSDLIETIRSLKQQISVRQEAENALASEKERLSVTLASIGDGVIATDNQGGVVLMNTAAEELLGCSQGDALGRRLSEVYRISGMMEDKESVIDRYVLAPLKGDNRYVSQRRAPIRGNSGNVMGEIIVFRDVSAEVRFEEFISKRNKFLSSLLESVTHPFYVIEVDTHLVKMANSAANFGPLSESSTCHSLTHNRQSPCSGKEHPCTIEEVLRTRGPVVLEHVHYDEAGEPMYIEVHCYPIYDEGGRIIEVVEYTIDITTRKRQEEKLLRSSSLEAIGRLAAGVAHEINTPLTNASLAMELLLSDGECVRSQQADLKRIKSIERNIEKASKIAQELLWFSRQREFELTTFDVSSVIESAIVMSEWMFRNVEVRNECQSVPPVAGDPQKLEQALINIFSNAVEAMPDGGVIGIRTFAEDGWVVVKISDTGMGIEEEDIKRLFEPFFTTKERGKGTGLGLSICSDIIERHNGELKISSQKDKGTVVTIKLPASVEAFTE